MPDELTPEAWQARLDRVSQLFDGMMETAKSLEGKRCPYKDKHDRCTAKFGCRNQRRPPTPGERMICGGDDRIDWRSAWDVS